MNATLHTFPPLQSMNSPRGVILAAIVLLHCGFFLALSSGMSIDVIKVFRTETKLVTPPPIDMDDDPPQPTTPPNIDFKREVFVPEPDPVALPDDAEAPTAPRGTVSQAPPVAPTDRSGSTEPVIAMPSIDPRIGLSEPPYPASEIRAGHAGTVLLSIYVLENGRVGDVKLDQSSGYAKLDDAALREARRWRLQPGMRDGVPVAMWKQIPITFQLQNGNSRRF